MAEYDIAIVQGVRCVTTVESHIDLQSACRAAVGRAMAMLLDVAPGQAPLFCDCSVRELSGSAQQAFSLSLP